MLFYFYRIGLKNVATDKSRSSQVDNKIHSMVASVNPTFLFCFCFGLWSLPEWSEGPQMLAQFIYDNENWFYEKKISKFFQNFFQFFSVFWTPFTHKKIFLHFWAKNNLLLYTWRATCPFDPQKMLFRGSFYKVSLKCPPP